MRILLIRHGDPDYENDTLTETGIREAKALAEFLKDEQLGDIYVSPLGRAQDTCRYTLEATGKQAVTLQWLREFDAQVDANGNDYLAGAYRNDLVMNNGRYEPNIAWDMLPRYMAMDESYLTTDGWRSSEVAAHSRINEQYDWVCRNLDGLLESYGYRREGRYYVTDQGSHDTITLFCHFGVSMVILSHLINASIFALWHGFCSAPASVTEIVTQEREKGIADFRCLSLGVSTYLEQPSFSARFCEVFEDEERH